MSRLIKGKPTAKDTKEDSEAENEHTWPIRSLRSNHMDRAKVVLTKISPLEVALKCSPRTTNTTPSEASDSVATTKSRKKRSIPNDSLILKNTNKAMHCLNEELRSACLLCEYRGLYMVSHYANKHPNAENYLARVSPEIGQQIRTPHKLDRCVRVGKKLQQLCLFCNETKAMPRNNWVSHFSMHTGEYLYKCDTCKLLCNAKQSTVQHKEICGNPVIRRLSVTNFGTPNLIGHVCSLCNYTQFDKQHVLRHLTNQHSETKTAGKVFSVEFLRKEQHPAVQTQQAKGKKIPAKRKSRAKPKAAAKSEEEEEDESSDESEAESDGSESDVPMPKLTNQEDGYNANAFIARPKEEDCLFDKDTMRIMNDMSFSNGVTPVTPPRPTGTSMADKLSERFRSASQSDVGETSIKASPGSTTSSGSGRKPLKFDVTLSIGNTLIDKQELLNKFALKNDIIPIVNQSAEGDIGIKSDLEPTAKKDARLTEAKSIDLDDDEWEDCSDDEPSAVDISDSLVITKEETSPPVVTPAPSTTTPPRSSSITISPPESKPIVDPIVLTKNNLHDTVNRLYKSFKIKPMVGPTGSPPSGQPLKLNNTQLTVSKISALPTPTEPTSLLAAINKASAVTQSVMNRFGPLGCSPFKAVPSLPAAVSQPAVKSQLADITKPAVISQPAAAPIARVQTANVPSSSMSIQSVKTINRIDNLGFSIWNNVYAYCCLIDDCGFESNRNNLNAHLRNHKTQWTGYCFMCDQQVSF